MLSVLFAAFVHNRAFPSRHRAPALAWGDHNAGRRARSGSADDMLHLLKAIGAWRRFEHAGQLTPYGLQARDRFFRGIFTLINRPHHTVAGAAPGNIDVGNAWKVFGDGYNLRDFGR